MATSLLKNHLFHVLTMQLLKTYNESYNLLKKSTRTGFFTKQLALQVSATLLASNGKIH